MSNRATIPRWPLKNGYGYCNKSEDNKNEYDKNNGKIVSLSHVITEKKDLNFQDGATIDVMHINVRKIRFLLTNTWTAISTYLILIIFQGVWSFEFSKTQTPWKITEILNPALHEW